MGRGKRSEESGPAHRDGNARHRDVIGRAQMRVRRCKIPLRSDARKTGGVRVGGGRDGVAACPALRGTGWGPSCTNPGTGKRVGDVPVAMRKGRIASRPGSVRGKACMFRACFGCSIPWSCMHESGQIFEKSPSSIVLFERKSPFPENPDMSFFQNRYFF